MSLLNKPIEDVIETLYNSIKSKSQIITNIKNEYNINNDTYDDIKINRLKLIDLLNEFEVTISQSLQAIRTFKVEIFNLKEKQATEEILNLTNEFQLKNNHQEKINSKNNDNILDKFDFSKTDNSIIEPKNDNINEKKSTNLKQNININLKKENIKENNNNKEFSVLKDAKLNFDYSNLLNNSQSSLRTSLSNLDKYKNNNNKLDINISQKKENDMLLNTDIENNKSNKKEEQVPLEDNTDIELINNNLNKEDIEEEQPSKLNINIIKSNNQLINKIKLEGNSNSNKDISCFSENFDYFKPNNNFESNTNISNKYYSMRQTDLNNINVEQNYNYKFNLLNTNSTNNIKKNEKIDLNNNIQNNSNYEESDIISLVSKNDIIKEKFKKLENDEKISKLIEEIFSIKAFKLYILDKFGNGKQDIFFKKIKNGEINKDELESELNLLKEIHNSNNDNDIDNNIDNNFYFTESKKQNNNRKVMNKTMSEINLNMNSNNMNIDNENNNFLQTDKYNIYKRINKKKYNKINEESKNRNPNNLKINLREKEKIIISNNTNSSMNKNKNTSSHSVTSIRAKIKSKKF